MSGSDDRSEDEDAALLRRFAALRAPSLPPDPDHDPAPESSAASASRSAALDPSAQIAAATQRAREEDDDLARIADGRPLDPGGAWGGVREETDERGREEREFEERVRALRGAGGGAGGGPGLLASGAAFGGGGGDESARGGDGGAEGDQGAVDGDDDDIDIEAYLASFTDKVPPPGSVALSPSSGRGEMPRGDTDDLVYTDAADDKTLQAQMDRLLGLTRHLVSARTSSGSEDGVDGPRHSRSAGPGDDRADTEYGASEWDGETEEEILQRALDEAALEGPSPDSPDPALASGPSTVPRKDPTTAQDKSSRSAPAHNPTADPEADAFPSLPAVPSLALPDPPFGDLASDADAALEARMALLAGLSGPSTQPGVGVGVGLPSVPKAAPGSVGATSGSAVSRQAGQGWGLPGWADGRDDDMDSWCCICNKDATIICAGCDADVYCDECWASGHGPGGEVGHRARRFVWGGGRGGPGAGMGGDVGGRRAVGA